MAENELVRNLQEDNEVLQRALVEAREQLARVEQENKNLRESSVRQSQKAVRLELEKDTAPLERHNRELRWQLTMALGKLPAKDVHEVLGSTEE